MQSGSLGGSFLRKASDVDLGVSWFVSLGDKSDISGNDLLQFWEQDDNTTVIAMYTESFGNPRKFARIARRVSRTKPIVAVRTGAAATGEMGGALYQQAGLIEVPTVPALLETVRVMATQPVLEGPRVAVVTNSRSPGTLARAALESAGLVPVDGPVTLDWSAAASDYPDGDRGGARRRRHRRHHGHLRPGGRRGRRRRRPRHRCCRRRRDEARHRGDARRRRRPGVARLARARRSRSPNRPPLCSAARTATQGGGATRPTLRPRSLVR